MLIEEYLEILAEWKLTDAGWGELKRRAKCQFAFFPRIAELEVIYQEIKQVERELRRKEERQKIEAEWERQAEPPPTNLAWSPADTSCDILEEAKVAGHRLG